MYKRDKIGHHHQGRPWYERILILWEEDDARPPDRERGPEALSRISGQRQLVKQRSYRPDDDDWCADMYNGGWVLGQAPDGAFVGVVVRES